MTEREIQDLFREMREGPIPADSLARVRLGVADRIAKRGWRPAWKIGAALVLAGCIVAGFLLSKPAARTPVPIQPPSAPEVALVQAPPEVPVRTVPRPRRPQRVEGLPVLIRIETPDPDVVILLVN